MTRCRWLAQNGESFPMIMGLLFVLTFYSLIGLNVSDPGILHRGKASNPGRRRTLKTTDVCRIFQMPWCPKCYFHCSPRTFHCPWCNICVEEFDHHCKWVNNCIGHRNFRIFLLLLVSLCFYLGALLLTCIIFLQRMRHMSFSLDKAMAVHTAPRAHSGKNTNCGEGRTAQGLDSQGAGPFNQGCANNWYLTICMPVGPK
ncbi:LOW QUALITY PROTEIN: palmitoyltransferase ZDHHC19 [Urocitellus parryii]